MKSFLLVLITILSLTILLLCAGCPKSSGSDANEPTSVTPMTQSSSEREKQGSNLSGTIRIDGSSTVYPITAAVAEEFMSENSGVSINVGVSGTSGGFKKFIAGETDISDASRPIKMEEIDKLKEVGIDFVEIPIAYDGIAVVVNPQNDWVDFLTIEELKEIWQPDSRTTKWSDVREGFPDEPINCYGPGQDSGTFEYFTEAIVGEARSSRQNYTPSEDDNILVQGISGDKDSLGYFGYAYYVENKDKLKLVPIKNGEKVIAPSPETINDGTYQPLSRPLFIYLSTKSCERPEIASFIDYYLNSGREQISEVGYVPLPDEVYTQCEKHFNERITGTVFGGKGATPGIMLLDLMKEYSSDVASVNDN